MTDRIEELIRSRMGAHGDYADVAGLFQQFMRAAHAGGAGELDHCKYMAVVMIFAKLSRIIAGDPEHMDHWIDIEGYARLARHIACSGKEVPVGQRHETMD